MNSQGTPDPQPKPSAPAEKYEKPAIIWRNDIDTKALSIGCAKSDPITDPQCAFGNAQS